MFFVAGSVDRTLGYAPGVRNIYEGSVNAPRYLLTYENAGHNAGAPMPAPKSIDDFRARDFWGRSGFSFPFHLSDIRSLNRRRNHHRM